MQANSPVRIALAGGGTGGHIYPALAVAHELQTRAGGVKLLYVGSRTGMESRLVPAGGLAFAPISARKLRRLWSPGTAVVAASLVRGFSEAVGHLRRFRPDVLLSTGGYAAAAAALAAARLRVPVAILAPDAAPGRTNRWLARFASLICVAFPETEARFPAGRAVATGVPLRPGALLPQPVTPDAARVELGALEAGKFTVLICGGSQGARGLNTVAAAAAGLLPASVQALHQTGERNLECVRQELSAGGDRAAWNAVGVLDEHRMALAYRAADLVICRGGISTLCEVLANSRPALVVPLPTAYADHQTANGRVLERAGAAEVLPQHGLDGEKMAAKILEMQSHPEKLCRMSRAAETLARPNAASDVACRVLALAGGSL